jgi:hypothetical protein
MYRLETSEGLSSISEKAPASVFSAGTCWCPFLDLYASSRLGRAPSIRPCNHVTGRDDLHAIPLSKPAKSPLMSDGVGASGHKQILGNRMPPIFDRHALLTSERSHEMSTCQSVLGEESIQPLYQRAGEGKGGCEVSGFRNDKWAAARRDAVARATHRVSTVEGPTGSYPPQASLAEQWPYGRDLVSFNASLREARLQLAGAVPC